MRVKSIFVAYPYKFGAEYRASLTDKFRGSGVEFRYADDELENGHVMQKICRMMSEADVCMFDVTDNNPNVMFELGYALGAQETGFVVIHESAVPNLSADLTGWDQLRYSSLSDLADKVYERVDRVRISSRRAAKLVLPAATNTVHATRDVIRELRFGIPRIDAPLLLVYVVPREYRRHLKERNLLGQPPFRSRDLCDIVLSGQNTTQYNTFFWPNSFDWEEPGPDFIEVYEGTSRHVPQDREVSFRVYTSGAVFYMQRLRYGGSDKKPFLYEYMYDEIVEMALLSCANAREVLEFPGGDELEVGTIFLNASELRVSRARRDFYPAHDAGRPLIEPSDELWLPGVPLSVQADDLSSKAKDLANELTAYLRTELNSSKRSS